MLPTSSTTVAQQTGITSAYTYDRTGRLTASAHSATPAQALPSGWSLSDIIGPNSMGYAYDANGNRTQAFYSITTGGGTTTVRRDVQASAGTNRVTGYTQTDTLPGSTTGQVSTVAFTLNTGGSITRMGDTYLHYSPQGRIARTSLNSNAQIAQAVDYTYTSASQRVFKRDARLSTTTPATEHTVYADDEIGSTVLGVYGNRRSTTSAAPTGEMDSTEVIYLPTPGGPMPIAAQINGRAYAIHTDHLNTPRRLTNAQGQVAWQWLVTGFGEVQPTLGTKGYALSGIDNSRVYSEAVTFNLRYPGQQWDEETKLSYNLNRYYDAQTGRYIQSDPIGLEGGWNRFGYVGGNPLSDVDPLGLCCLNHGSCMSFPNNPLKKNPNYHEYETLMVICKLSPTCTRDAVFNRLKEFPTPAGPKRGGINTCDVSDIGGQKVSHVVDEKNFALFNNTLPGHMFDPGYVYRNVFVDENGNVVLRTYGEGTGDFKGFNDFFGKYGWPAVDSRIQKPFR